MKNRPDDFEDSPPAESVAGAMRSLTLPNEYGIVGKIEISFSQEDIRREPLVYGRLDAVREQLGPMAQSVVALIPAELRANDLYVSVKRHEHNDDYDKSPGNWHIDGNIEVKDGQVNIKRGPRMLCIFGDVANTELLTNPPTIDLSSVNLSQATGDDLAWLVSTRISAQVAGGIVGVNPIPNQTPFQFNLDTVHRRGEIKKSGVRLLVGFGPMS